MELDRFLETVTGAEARGEAYLHVVTIPAEGGTWFHKWFKFGGGADRSVVLKFIKDHADHNVYFSPHLYSKPHDDRENLLHSRTIVVDIDSASLDDLPIAPSILVQTSEIETSREGTLITEPRYQAYWLLRSDAGLEAVETFQRNLTYAVPEADRASWPLGYLVRVPTTLNYKYLGAPFPVAIMDESLTRYDPADLELLPAPSKDVLDLDAASFISDPPSMENRAALLGAEFGGQSDPDEIVMGLKSVDKLNASTANRYFKRSKDRPGAQWQLILSLLRTGISRTATFYIVQEGANNPYAELVNKQAAARELAKDVLRGEAVATTRAQEPRSVLSKARKQAGFAFERRSQLANLVLSFMKQSGDFVRTSDAHAWYIDRTLGKPIAVEKHNSALDSLLSMRYGLNPTETDQQYVVAHLLAYAYSMPTTAIQSSLAWFTSGSTRERVVGHDPNVILHTGKKEVIVIRKDAIEKSVNGSHGVVFPWPPTVEPFSPILVPEIETDSSNGTRRPTSKWQDVLFGDGLQNVTNINHEEATAMLSVWFMSLLFRSSSISRPIIALFGQPGSGKSTTFRKVYALLYGRTRSLSSVTSAEDYDHAVAADPLVVLDNVDTWERWLPDRLALSASTSDITKRRLYTNSDVVILKRQALVALTAHNPQFGRPDVADRLLIINLERITRFRPEQDIINRIQAARNYLWGGIVLDVQKILNTPMPDESTVPQFRIEDFARWGCWIADGLECRPAFESALTRIQQSQRRFVLEDDNVLVECFNQALLRTTPPMDTGWITAGALWHLLWVHARDQAALQRIYKNASTLSKKMVALKEPLKEVFEIEWKYDTAQGGRLWRIRKKQSAPQTTSQEQIGATTAALASV